MSSRKFLVLTRSGYFLYLQTIDFSIAALKVALCFQLQLFWILMLEQCYFNVNCFSTINLVSNVSFKWSSEWSINLWHLVFQCFLLWVLDYGFSMGCFITTALHRSRHFSDLDPYRERYAILIGCGGEVISSWIRS